MFQSWDRFFFAISKVSKLFSSDIQFRFMVRFYGRPAKLLNSNFEGPNSSIKFAVGYKSLYFIVVWKNF